jgi:hypothetical protein
LVKYCPKIVPFSRKEKCRKISGYAVNITTTI